MSSERDESFLSKRKKKGGKKAGKFELFWHRECVGPKQTLELIWHLNLLDLNLSGLDCNCISSGQAPFAYYCIAVLVVLQSLAV